MSISLRPIEPAPAYRPVRWIVNHAYGALTPSDAQATIAHGINTYTLSKQAFFGFAGTAQFEVDIQQIARNVLRPSTLGRSSVFASLGSDVRIINPDMYAKLGATFEYFYIDSATNLRTSTGATDTDSIYVFAASTQHTEQPNLEPFLLDALGTERMLTNADNVQVFATDSHYMSYIGALPALTSYTQPEAFEVITYLADGTVQSQGIWLLSYAGTDAYFQGTIGVGPANLNATPPDFGVFIIDANTAYYTVQLIDKLAPIQYTSRTYTFIYTPHAPCINTTRIYFLNSLGGCDAFNFTALREQSTQSQSAQAMRPLLYSQVTNTNPHRQVNRGRNRIGIEQTTFLRCVSRNLTEEQAQWLLDLQGSPEIYTEQGGEYLPLVLAEEPTLTTQTDNLITFECVFQLANDRIALNM